MKMEKKMNPIPMMHQMHSFSTIIIILFLGMMGGCQTLDTSYVDRVAIIQEQCILDIDDLISTVESLNIEEKAKRLIVNKIVAIRKKVAKAIQLLKELRTKIVRSNIEAKTALLLVDVLDKVIQKHSENNK